MIGTCFAFASKRDHQRKQLCRECSRKFPNDLFQRYVETLSKFCILHLNLFQAVAYIIFVSLSRFMSEKSFEGNIFRRLIFNHKLINHIFSFFSCQNRLQERVLADIFTFCYRKWVKENSWQKGRRQDCLNRVLSSMEVLGKFQTATGRKLVFWAYKMPLKQDTESSCRYVT